MLEHIREGSMVFASDGEEGIGAVRELRPGSSELVIYVENGGDFVVPVSAVRAVHSDKVVLNLDRLDAEVRDAIRHARDSEDPYYVSPDSTDESGE
ncbi:hypothetical protein ACFPME_03675 [Rhodanobacter umsongensis]|uniref:DUF2171 domain-containing protein n=1 Tax=Rhodanobacter umsongensis TaxID=633153 RepID=A0ABW0JI35_9GAMM